MNMNILALAVLSAVSATAIAAGPASKARPLGLAQMVAHVESTYKGEVVGIQLDNSGDKRPHYHVDIRYPQIGVAKVDIDAVTRELSARDTGLPPGSATLAEVATLVAAQLPGQLIVAELDAADGVAPHYDVDVRVPGRKIARLKVDAATRWIGWRQPAVIDE